MWSAPGDRGWERRLQSRQPDGRLRLRYVAVCQLPSPVVRSPWIGARPLGGYTKAGGFALAGVMGYVRGKNLGTEDNLYHMMPVHGDLALEHHRGEWSSAIDLQAVDVKTDVQAVRNELPTPGYAPLNLRSGYCWKLAESAGLRLDAGIGNLANKKYDCRWAAAIGPTPRDTGPTFEF